MGFNGTRYCSRKCLLLSNYNENDAGCWIWTGYTRPGGYGEAYFGDGPNRERVLAHRAMFTAFFGDPGEKLICHKCDVPACVNPEHLFAGSAADNMADRQAKQRQARGERNGPSKLTEAQVRAIRADTRGPKVVARDYGIYETTVSSIRSRRTWKHVE